MKDLIIVGAGGLGREVAWLASEAVQEYKVIGFLDDRNNIPPKELGGYELLGGIQEWQMFPHAEIIVTIGNPRTRSSVVARIEQNSTPDYATLVHRSCHIGPECHIASGSMICAGCILTTNIDVGQHVIININTTVGHDCKIGAYSTIAPQVAISGCVAIGDGTEIGTSSSIKQGVKLGNGSMLGMGSSLTKPIPDNTFFYGVPAKSFKALKPFGLQ